MRLHIYRPKAYEALKNHSKITLIAETNKSLKIQRDLLNKEEMHYRKIHSIENVMLVKQEHQEEMS